MNRKKLLELCAYLAFLIFLITYAANGGYEPKAAQLNPPPQKEYQMPTPEPRQILEG